MTAQAGTVYRYFRLDADHDVSGDTLELSLCDSDSWFSTGVTFIPSGSRPPACVAADAASPPAAGSIGHWWRVLTGPSTELPLVHGYNTVHGRLTDSPEIPHFLWEVNVLRAE